MILAKVIGTVVSTRKSEKLVGSKFLNAQIIENGVLSQKYLVCVDTLGAGIGDICLVATGSAARKAIDNENAPVDACIIGIVDPT